MTAAATGAPLADVGVRAWDAGGSQVRSSSTDSTGVYTIDRLASGTYYVTTSNDDDYLDELYDDIPCLGGGGSGCTPTKGTPVEVSVNTTTRHIHFALQFLGGATSGITGTVTDGTSHLAGVFVDAWDGGGLLAASAVTGAAGDYLLELDPGTYFVSTDNGRDFADEVYDDLLCLRGPAALGLCDPTQGTPIEGWCRASRGVSPSVGTGIRALPSLTPGLISTPTASGPTSGNGSSPAPYSPKVSRSSSSRCRREYTATTPPHVAAARKMSGPSGRLIAYVMTTGGAEPAAERCSPIDYEHYVDKRVRPVAEPVLGILDLDFDRAIGDDVQLELF